MTTADALVRRAARRWPAEQQDDMAAEWLAELTAMRREGVPGWRRLTYAMSLFASAPVEEAGCPPRMWREEIPSLGRAAAHLLALVVVAFGAAITASQLPTLARALLIDPRGDDPGTYVIGRPTPIQWGADSVALASLLLACAAFGWLGLRLGRVIPLRWARYIGLGVAGPGAVAAAVVGAALAGALEFSGGNPAGGLGAASGSAVTLWTVLAVLVTVASVRPSRHRWLAIALGVLGNLVALEIVGMLVSTSGPGKPLWFPLSLLDLENSGISIADNEMSFGNVNIVGAMTRPMLLCAAFLLCYTFRAARARPAAPALRTVSAVSRPVPAAPISLAVAAALAAAGVALWVYTAAGLTPAIERMNGNVEDTTELHLWAQEQRELAIALVVVALVAAIIRRGPVSAPAALTYAALFCTDCIVDANGLSGQRTAVAMVVVGVAVLGCAWWLSGRLAVRSAEPFVTRRVGASVAIAAALVTPMLGDNIDLIHDFSAPPAGLLPGAIVVMTLMWCAAVAVAFAAREGAASRRVVAAYLLVPLILLYAGGAVDGVNGVPFYAGPVLGLVALSAVLGRGTIRPLRWLLLGVAGLLATVPYIVGSIVVGFIFGGALMAAAGFDYPADGVPMMPGGLAIALGAGLLLAMVAVRKPPPVPEPEVAARVVMVS